MKVEKLYRECKKLMESGHSQYDVTIEMMGDVNQRDKSLFKMIVEE